jgi:dTDP-4-amino-4,6-dideoxygalactose transaminase
MAKSAVKHAGARRATPGKSGSPKKKRHRPETSKRSFGATKAIPALDLTRQYESIQGDVQRAIKRVCASQHFIMGEEVARFEEAAADFLHVKHAVSCASGTDAIWLAFQAAGIGSGDEVITTPFSFFASASAMVRAGAKPVFVDVDEETLNLDADAIRKRMKEYPSAKLSAMMPVHLFGQCAEMDELGRVAAEFKFRVLEDAAQAFGAAWRGKRAGGLGEAAAFSFYPTKNLSCYGDGGLVTTNDAAIADRVRLLRNHGSRQRYYHEELGWNSRLDALQAAILTVKLKHIEQWNQKRAQRAEAYGVLFKSSGLLAPRVTGNKGSAPIRFLGRQREAFHIFHQFVVRAERRDELRKFLTERKIGTEIYYPVPLHLQKCFAYLGYSEGDLPVSERAAKEVLALPMFPELTPQEQATVVSAIADFYS